MGVIVLVFLKSNLAMQKSKLFLLQKLQVFKLMIIEFPSTRNNSTNYFLRLAIKK